MPLSLTKAYLQEHYWDAGKSAAMVAREAGTYPNDVRRHLLKFWPSLRDRSETMKAALAGGHAKPPMAGRRHTAASKLKASESASRHQASLSKRAKAEASEAGKARWAALSPAKKDKFLRAGDKALRAAARKGSRLERFLAKRLKKAGVEVEHREDFGDLFLPELGVAVFVCPPPALDAAFAEADRLDGNARDKRLRCLLARLHVVNVRPLRRPTLARMALVLDRLADAVHSLPEGGPFKQITIGDDDGEEKGDCGAGRGAAERGPGGDAERGDGADAAPLPCGT